MVGECCRGFIEPRSGRRVRISGRQRVESREKIREALQRLLRLRHHAPREFQLLAVVRVEIDVAECGGPESLRGNIFEVVHVAERLRHLLGAGELFRLDLDHQVLDVHPEARELAVGGPFRLRDFVLVVREDQIDAAAVKVDRQLAEQLRRHRGTLDVPPGAARRQAGLPRRLSRFDGLPENEIPRVVLFVLVAVDARAALDPGVIEPRELAVFGKGRNFVVDGSVGRIGVAVALERLDHAGHRRDVIGRARRVLDRLEAECRRVALEGLDELLRMFAQRLPRLQGFRDGSIVDVGVVAHLPDGIAFELERAPQDIERDERAEVADVATRVHRQPARVHPHRLAIRGGKRFFASCQGIEESHPASGHDVSSMRLPLDARTISLVSRRSISNSTSASCADPLVTRAANRSTALPTLAAAPALEPADSANFAATSAARSRKGADARSVSRKSAPDISQRF